MTNKQKKRSPLRDKPLHVPGQSIDNQIQDEWLDFYLYFLFPFILLAFMAATWLNQLAPRSSSIKIPPYVSTIITIVILFVVVGYCIYGVIRSFKKIRRLTMARDGERIVAEEIQILIRDGAAVFHDIVSDKFNLDHVVVSKHGIFLIETKTYSKPIDKEAKISFDEDHIFVDGKEYDRNPIEQVKASTKWLQNLIKESTGIKFAIRPVVLFPGWFIEPMKRGQNIWILNPKALPAFVSNEPITLKDTEVHLIAFHLSRYIRTFEPKG
jgi:hypothetical protein